MAAVGSSIFLIVYVHVHVLAAAGRTVLEVDAANRIGTLNHFWASTGLSPPEPYDEASHFLLDRDMILNLAFIGALPRHHRLMQVRIHWLLNLIKMRMDEGGIVRYDFEDLDVLVGHLHRHELKPGFELMGNPSGYFTDFENGTQVYRWKDMITTLAKRYMKKYGLQYLKQWNFESWNEPDHGDFDGLNFTIQGFLNYYDACSEGLLAAHPALRFGGPAESFHENFVYCWALLEHCVLGRNYLTGEKGVRLDFISMHKKGNRSSISILQEEIETIKKIQSQYPSLKKTPIYNDEADPEVGWWKPEAWRSDNTYASMVAKVITQHQDFLLGGQPRTRRPAVDYRLLSNDNAFLPFEPHPFEQRTLMARFRRNGTEGPPTAQMIRKPVYMVIGLLLHVLGEEQVRVRRRHVNRQSNCGSLGALAAMHTVVSSNTTRDSWNLGVIVYNSEDMNSSSQNDVTLEVHFKGLNKTELMYVTYAMDNIRTNPASAWERMGRPVLPDDAQLKILRNLEGPISSKPRRLGRLGRLETTSLRQPGFLAIHLCSKAPKPPGQVTHVSIYNVSLGNVLVTWQTNRLKTRCIWTFEVQFSRFTEHRLLEYRTITRRRPIVFRSFQFTPSTAAIPKDDRAGIVARDIDGLVRGFYRVRVIDYWRRPGRWSTPTSYAP